MVGDTHPCFLELQCVFIEKGNGDVSSAIGVYEKQSVFLCYQFHESFLVVWIVILVSQCFVHPTLGFHIAENIKQSREKYEAERRERVRERGKIRE